MSTVYLIAYLLLWVSSPLIVAGLAEIYGQLRLARRKRALARYEALLDRHDVVRGRAEQRLRFDRASRKAGL